MGDKEKFRQFIEEQLSQWKKELIRLRERASEAGSDVVKNLPEKTAVLEKKIEEGTKKIKELAEANEESWESLKDGFESAWESISSGFRDAKEKFKWGKD